MSPSILSYVPNGRADSDGGFIGEKKVQAQDRKRWWKAFLNRLQGRDILDRMRKR